MSDVEDFKPIGTEQPNLTKWKKEPTCADLKADLELARAYHDNHMIRVKDWLDCYNGTGEYEAPKVKGRSRIAPKLVRKLVEWRVPALTEPFLSRPDLIQVEPVSYEDVAASKQNQLLINYQFRSKINLTRFIDQYVRTAAQEGTSILRAGWAYEEEVIEVEEPTYQFQQDPRMATVYESLMPALMQNPESAESLDPSLLKGLQYYQETGLVGRYVQTGTKTVEKTQVTKNHPTVEVCDIGSIYVDSSCYGDLTKAKFLIYGFETCKADLRADSKYVNVENIDVKVAAQPLTSPTHDNRNVPTTEFKDEERERIVAYEYWGYFDIDDSGTLRPVVATWVGDTIIHLEENPFPDGEFPFIFVPYLPIKDSLYGEPDAELLKDNQKVIGATTRGMVDLMARSANGQTGFAKNFLDTTNFTRYNNGENYLFNPTGPVDRSIVMHKFPDIPQSAFNMHQFWHNDAESLVGVKPFGASPAGSALGDSVQAARNAMDAASKRELSIIRRLSDGLIGIARKFTAMNAQFLTSEDFIRVTNEEFIPVKPDDLAGDFDFKITISTAEEDMAKTEQLAFLLQTGQASMPFEFSQKLLSKLATLRKMPDLAQFIDQYKPQPNPLAEAREKLELAKIEAEIANLQMQAAESDAKRRVYEAEVGVRDARKDSIISKTDKDNLDFYKDANGIKHQEEMDKQNAVQQANAVNQDIKHAQDMQKLQFNHNSQVRLKHADAALNPPAPGNSSS